MILRRLYEHVHAHNWFAVAVDFVIVVVGVFVGIQVSNWNVERLEQRAARVYIERIREDISVSELTLRDQIAFHRSVEEHGLAALNSFDKSPDKLGESFLIDAFLASRIATRTVDRSSYEEMLANGRTNSIPNPEIRRRLATYYRTVTAIEDAYRYIPPYWDNLRRLMPWPAQYAMIKRCDLIFSVDAHGRALSSLPEHCELGLTREVTASAVAEIHNPELKRDLVRRLADLEARLKIYQRLIDQGKSLDEFLAASKF